MAVTTMRRDPHAFWLSQQLEECKQRRVGLEQDIQRLQRQAEVILAREQAFREALEDHERNVPPIAASSLSRAERPKPVRRTAKGAVGGKFGVILDQVAQAGPRGLTVNEMYEFAEQAKLGVKRNTLRSQLWHRKNEGKLELINGYYRIPQKSDGTMLVQSEAQNDTSEGPDDSESSGPSGLFAGAA